MMARFHRRSVLVALAALVAWSHALVPALNRHAQRPPAACLAPSRPAHTLSQPRQHANVLMTESEDWTSKIFSAENAGPWLILVVVLLFEGLNVLTRLGVELPPFLADLIPLILGEQYAPK